VTAVPIWNVDVPTNATITRARETFRVGETVQVRDRPGTRPSRYGRSGKRRIDCGSRHRGITMRKAVRDRDAGPQIAFHVACDQRDLEVADQPIAILKQVLRRPQAAGRLRAACRRATVDRTARAATVAAPFPKPATVDVDHQCAHETFRAGEAAPALWNHAAEFTQPFKPRQLAQR
jgi:hypothetical protein